MSKPALSGWFVLDCPNGDGLYILEVIVKPARRQSPQEAPARGKRSYMRTEFKKSSVAGRFDQRGDGPESRAKFVHSSSVY